MSQEAFVAGYHAGYLAAVEHIVAEPGIVLPAALTARLGDEARRQALAEAIAPGEKAASVETAEGAAPEVASAEPESSAGIGADGESGEGELTAPES